MSWRGTAALALTALLGVLPAGEATRISLVLDGQPAQTVMALAGRLGAGDQHRDSSELAAGAGARPLIACLVDASPAGLRQALAHAQGCWWLADDGGALYTLGSSPPLGPTEVSTRTSGLINQPGLEAQVRQLLAPWLSDPACGLTYLPDEGLWTATLDKAGHARLLEALTLLERNPAFCPPLLADPDQPSAELRLDTPLVASGWGDLCAKLATGLRLSVSCSPTLPALPAAFTINPGTLNEICTQLMAVNVRSAVLHGVLCVGSDQPREREHPALRRRLAHLPVGHVLSSATDGQLLVTMIRARVAAWWWDLPGAALFYQSDQRALVVAADPETLHAVVDLLDKADLLGFDQAFSEAGP